MEIKVLNDKILLGDRDDVLRIYIRAKLLERNIRHYDHDIDIILELYKRGGYSNNKEQNDFISTCIVKGFKKSDQSVRNTLTIYTKFNVLKKRKWLSLCVSEDFLPPVMCDKLVVHPLISHKN